MPGEPEGERKVVGHDVWLGYAALVLPGVTIGHGAVVAATSVVAADVPPYAVVAGNPACVVRRRFDDAEGRAIAPRSVVELADRPGDQTRTHDHGGNARRA